MNLNIVKFECRPRSYRTSNSHRELTAKTRVYVSHEGESVLEGFGNRAARPSTLYRKLVMPYVMLNLSEAGWEGDVDPEEGSTEAKFYWNKFAGCSSCPCSPGFVVEDHYGHDVWVTIAGVERTTDPELAAYRGAQLGATLSKEAESTG